jgi:hypothetical protein
MPVDGTLVLRDWNTYRPESRRDKFIVSFTRSTTLNSHIQLSFTQHILLHYSPRLHFSTLPLCNKITYNTAREQILELGTTVLPFIIQSCKVLCGKEFLKKIFCCDFGEDINVANRTANCVF